MSEELVEKVARAIAKRRMLSGDMSGIMAISPERFEAAFEKVWAGTTDVDERQRENYRGDARAAIALLPLTSEREGIVAWQPMTTAPKGTPVIVFSEKWGVTEGLLGDSGRWIVAAFNGGSAFVEPLCWQPRPAPPISTPDTPNE